MGHTHTTTFKAALTAKTALLAIAFAAAVCLLGLAPQAHADELSSSALDVQALPGAGVAFEAQAASGEGAALQLQATAKSQVVKRGTLKSGTRETETFIVPKTGYISFAVKLSKGVYNTALRIDMGDVRYVDATVNNSTITGGDGIYRTGRYSFKPGKKVKVTLEMPSFIISQKCNYRITMKHTVPPRYESELNNSKPKADTLKLGKAMSANILQKDTDWFVFKAPKAGTYKFAAKMLLPKSGESTQAAMTIYKGSRQIDAKYPASGDGYVKLAAIALKKGEKAYVKVKPYTATVESMLGNLPAGDSDSSTAAATAAAAAVAKALASGTSGTSGQAGSTSGAGGIAVPTGGANALTSGIGALVGGAGGANALTSGASALGTQASTDLGKTASRADYAIKVVAL